MDQWGVSVTDKDDSAWPYNDVVSCPKEVWLAGNDKQNICNDEIYPEIVLVDDKTQINNYGDNKFQENNHMYMWRMSLPMTVTFDPTDWWNTISADGRDKHLTPTVYAGNPFASSLKSDGTTAETSTDHNYGITVGNIMVGTTVENMVGTTSNNIERNFTKFLSQSHLSNVFLEDSTKTSKKFDESRKLRHVQPSEKLQKRKKFG